VMQHGLSANEIRTANALATIAAALEPQNARYKWLVAASWDRLLVDLHKPQWYATQYVSGQGGKFALYPVDESITDADRLEMGAPTLAEARKRADQMAGVR
jgi:hypothetical protein